MDQNLLSEPAAHWPHSPGVLWAQLLLSSCFWVAVGAPSLPMSERRLAMPAGSLLEKVRSKDSTLYPLKLHASPVAGNMGKGEIFFFLSIVVNLDLIYIKIHIL